MFIDFQNCIWNREPLYRNRVFSTYLYVLSTYWYVPVQNINNSTDQYVLSTYQNSVMYVGHL